MPKSQRELARAVVRGLRRLKESVLAGQIDVKSENFQAVVTLLRRWDNIQTARGSNSIFTRWNDIKRTKRRKRRASQ